MTAQPITEAQARAAKARCDALPHEGHTHDSRGMPTGSGACAICGLNFRHFIHTRVGAKDWRAADDLPAAIAWREVALPLLVNYRDLIERLGLPPSAKDRIQSALDALLPPEAP